MVASTLDFIFFGLVKVNYLFKVLTGTSFKLLWCITWEHVDIICFMQSVCKYRLSYKLTSKYLKNLKNSKTVKLF